jgi:hypothetical protein
VNDPGGESKENEGQGDGGRLIKGRKNKNWEIVRLAPQP